MQRIPVYRQFIAAFGPVEPQGRLTSRLTTRPEPPGNRFGGKEYHILYVETPALEGVLTLPDDAVSGLPLDGWESVRIPGHPAEYVLDGLVGVVRYREIAGADWAPAESA